MRKSPSSCGRNVGSEKSTSSGGYHLRDDPESSGGAAMLPIFLNDLRRNKQDCLEVTLELDNSNVVCSVNASPLPPTPQYNGGSGEVKRILHRSWSAASRIRDKFGFLRTRSSRAASSEIDGTLSAREARKLKAEFQRSRSSAQKALNGLRFINKTTEASNAEELWKRVESRFDLLARDGLLSRQDFGECIGMADSKDFAECIFDALARRRKKFSQITKDELRDFWMQISDHSFDARLQIFFDMADRNEDGRITRKEVQELITLSASANKLSKLKEQAEEYASLIMEELDPENLGYIELWQLETLLMQRETYMNCNKLLSPVSVGWNHISSFQPRTTIRRLLSKLRWLIAENWQRSWILILWMATMGGLFVWKFIEYKNMAAFEVMGYCLATAKGAAETLKLNMALILLPVCRRTLTRLRATRARRIFPFDDNINFHKMIAFAIAMGVIVHSGNHLFCDFPRLTNASPEKFMLIAQSFQNRKPTYQDLLSNIEGVTGICMVLLILISFTLATHLFRRNVVKLPSPFNRLTGFNAFWYTHHLLGVVYILLLVHGTCLMLTQKWYKKTTWMYIAAPWMLYIAERNVRTCRSEHYSVKISKVSFLPGNVLSIIMLKPQGFKYRSGQYIFLQCPRISPFEWHPFSITSAPGDDYLSVHIRIVGDWTRELKRVLIDEYDSLPLRCHQIKFNQLEESNWKGKPKLYVDGPYGAPAQDYRNYDVLLFVGLGIGATPFVSVLKDLLNNTRRSSCIDSNTDTSKSDDSSNSCTSSSTTSRKKKTQKTTSAHFYWVTREPSSFEWFKGIMEEVAEIDHNGQIELHNYLTSVYEECDARSTLIIMIQALNHAKHGVDILSGTRVRTHFARPNWEEVFNRIASKHPLDKVGVFYCGSPMLAKELKRLCQLLSHRTTTRFEFHKEYF